MTKKIAHIIIGLNVGGAELMLQRLVLNSSKKEQFEHSVISITDLGIIGPKLQEQGIKVYSLGMNSLHNIPLTMFKLRRLLKKINPDKVREAFSAICLATDFVYSEKRNQFLIIESSIFIGVDTCEQLSIIYSHGF